MDVVSVSLKRQDSLRSRRCRKRVDAVEVSETFGGCLPVCVRAEKWSTKLQGNL
jgi:hypothetical protein